MANKSKAARKAAKAGKPISSVKIKREPADLAAKELAELKEAMLSPTQAKNGVWAAASVQNQTEAHQREMMRSGMARTLQRVCSVDVMLRRGELTKEEAAACSWFADTHTRGYSTVSVTARYGDTGTGGRHSYSHFAVDIEQGESRDNYRFARSCISPFLLPMFEAVILHGRSPTKHEMKIVKVAAIQLFGGVSHMILLR